MKEKLQPAERKFFFEAESWFNVSQTAENIWAIREPHHDQDVVSYFIQGEKRDVLIDSGMGLADINKTAPLTHRPLKKPLTVLLSHTHWDHMGGARDFSDVRVYNDQYEKSRIVSGWDSREMPGFDEEYFMGINIPPTYSADIFKIPGTPQARSYNDGEVFDLGNDQLRTIATPGHTPGSSSFLLERAGHLFTGDTLYVGPLYLHMPESNYGVFLKSIEKLSSYLDRINMIFPAHNDTSITPEKFSELLNLIRGRKKADFIEVGSDDYGEFRKLEWKMIDLNNNRTFSVLKKP